MKTISAFAFFLLVSILFKFGYSEAFAQGSTPPIAGSDLNRLESQEFYDSQLNLLWDANDAQSDSLLGVFFNNWRLETQIVEEPFFDSPISNATASLFTFLLNTDFQVSTYPYKYAVIQDRVEATMPSSSWSPTNDEEYTLLNYHPQSSDPFHPIYVMLDGNYNEMLYDFLGDWSELKAEGMRNFFKNYVPIGLDAVSSNGQNDWSLIRHWYTLSFSYDLQAANVSDQTPWGTDTYECVVNAYGEWEKVPIAPIGPTPLPPPGPPPGPTPYPPPGPPGPPPSPPTPPPVVVIHNPPPPAGPPPHRERPLSPSTQPTAPTNPNPPTNPVVRPRPINPPEHNPVTPQNPNSPERRAPTSPPPHEPPPPQSPPERPTQNPTRGNQSPPPQNHAPTERPRTVQPSQNNTTPNHDSSPKSPPPSDKKAQDQKKDRPR